MNRKLVVIPISLILILFVAIATIDTTTAIPTSSTDKSNVENQSPLAIDVNKPPLYMYITSEPIMGNYCPALDGNCDLSEFQQTITMSVKVKKVDGTNWKGVPVRVDITSYRGVNLPPYTMNATIKTDSNGDAWFKWVTLGLDGPMDFVIKATSPASGRYVVFWRHYQPEFDPND